MHHPLRRAAASAGTLVLILAACGGTGVETESQSDASTAATPQQPTATEANATVPATPEATPEPTPEATPLSTTFGVGEVVTITEDGDPWADFTVLEVQEVAEFEDPDGFYNDTPSTEGYVYLTAFVRYEAIASGVDYGPFDFQVFVDGRAVDNFAFAINGPEPELGSGTLPAGRVAEGWMLFEVPPTGEVLLSYSGNMFLDEEPIFEVVLRAS